MSILGEQPLSLSAEKIEAIRSSCPDHGDYYADVTQANSFLASLNETDLDPDQLALRIDEGGPMARQTWESTLAMQDLLDQATTSFAPRMRTILAQSRTSDINPFADEASTWFIERLGRPPDMLDIQGATIFFTFAAAIATRQTRRIASADMENSVVQQFSNMLLAKTDQSLICQGFAQNARRQEAEQQTKQLARQGAAAYSQLTGQYINENFIASKLMSLWINTGNAISLHKFERDMHETGEGIDAAELRNTNNTFIEYVKRVRNYGIKPIIFEFSDVVPGVDAVYHEFAQLGRPVKGEQPLALIRIVGANITPEEKVTLTLTPLGQVTEDLRGFDLGGLPLVLDGRGDIYAGHGISSSSIPLRIMFEQNGAAGKYELLRSALLSRLFDAVAPAEIVERLESAPRGPNTGSLEHVSSSAIQRLLLPRIRYLYSMNKASELRAEFNNALQREQEQTARQVAYHEIAPYLRNLPAAAKGPSDDAIKRAKEIYGPDFVLPEGKTFVRGYEYGNPDAGQVLGYIAVKRTARPGGPGKKKKK